MDSPRLYTAPKLLAMLPPSPSQTRCLVPGPNFLNVLLAPSIHGNEY